MSSSDDHLHEMFGDTLSDEAIEAFFSAIAHPGWDTEEALRTLADDVAVAVSGPAPAANHALLRFFWATDRPAPAVADSSHSLPAHMVHDHRPKARTLSGRFRLATGMALASFLAATGIGVAGAAGVLPGPVQRAVTGVVEAVTPFDLPEPTSDRSESPIDATPEDVGGPQPPAPVATTGPPPASGAAPASTPSAGSSAPQPPTPSAPASTARQPGAQAPTGAQPASPPPPAGPQAPPTTGLDRARQTPAAPYLPPAPPGPPAGTPRGGR